MFGGCSVKVRFGDEAFSTAFNDDLEARPRDEKAEAIVQRRMFQRPHQRAPTRHVLGLRTHRPESFNGPTLTIR
jgi:hypothetical protein